MNEDRRREEGPATLDEKLVAYLLGEAGEADAAEVEAALAADAALRARRDELEAALGLLRTPEIAPALAPERRDALRAAAARQAAGAPAGGGPAAAPAGRLRRFPMLRAAAGLLVFGGIVALAMQQPWNAGGSVRADAVLDARALDSLGYAADDGAANSRRDRSSRDGVAPSSEPEGAARPQEPAASLVDPGALDKSVGSAGGSVGSYRGPSDAVPQVNEGLLSNQAENQLGTLGYAGVAPGAGQPSGEALLALPDASVNSVLGAASAAPTPPARVPATPGAPTTGGLASGLPPAEGSLGLRRAGVDGKRAYADVPAADAGARGSADRGESLGRTDPIRKGGESLYWERERVAVDAYGYAYDLDVELDDEAGRPRCIVVDGYGRRYVDEDVLEHLRPHRGHRGPESPRDMFFRYYGDNPWVATADEGISTFAADVDTASYPLARNYLVQGHLPPKDAVRTEEFVNYFPLGLQPPAEGDFAVHLEAAPTVFGLEPRLLLRAGIKAREVSREERKPLNLVFVVDTSGSMASENRIELVKQALELLVDQVRDDDTIGIVRFSSEASEVLAPTRGSDRWEIRQAVRRLSTGGSTNAGAGLRLGYAMAERAFREGAVNRVVLASDGVANTGETDQERILADVRARAEAHIDLTTIGVGMGNHNDVFLEQLADKGDGSCHYVDDFEEAKRVLVDGFTGTMQTVARDVKIQLEFDGEIVRSWRQLGYENRALTTEQFRDDSVDAGEVGAGHEVAALYELDLAPGAAGDAKLVTLRLRWFPDGADEAVEEEHVLALAEARTKWALAPAEFRLSAVAAQFAEVLRRSYHAREDSYGTLREESEALARELRDARVSELRDLIQRTESLARRGPHEDPLVQLIEEARRMRLLEARLAMQERDADMDKALEEIRRQNERIEAQLQELLKKP